MVVKYKTYDNLISTRYVLIEKFNSKIEKYLNFKEELYFLAKKSTKKEIDEKLINCFSKLIIQEFSGSRFFFVDNETLGKFYSSSFTKCLQGYKHFNFNKDAHSFYNYVVQLIYSGIIIK